MKKPDTKTHSDEDLESSLNHILGKPYHTGWIPYTVENSYNRISIAEDNLKQELYTDINTEYEDKVDKLSCSVIFMNGHPNKIYISNSLCNLLDLKDEEYISIILDEEYNPYLIVATSESKDIFDHIKGSYYKLSKIFRTIKPNRIYGVYLELSCRFITNKKLYDFLQEILDMDYPDDIIFTAKILSEDNPISSLLNKYKVKKAVSLSRAEVGPLKIIRKKAEFDVKKVKSEYSEYLREQAKIYYETIKNYTR